MSVGFVVGVVSEYDADTRQIELCAPNAEPLVLALADDFDVYPSFAIGQMPGQTVSVLVQGDADQWTASFAMVAVGA
jgi:hypothetical protein